MSNIEQEISQLENQISELRKRLTNLKQEQAENTCPFKVKDVVVDNYGHRGVVSRIRPGYSKGEGRPVVRLFVKSGELGKRTNDYYSWKPTGEVFGGEAYL